MKVTGIRARHLQAQLAAPMRSRGNVGFTEYHHTGSEVQRLTVVEVVTDSEYTGITLLGGDARDWVRDVAEPALRNRDPRAIRLCREAVRSAAAERDPAGAHAGRFHLNRLEFALWDLLGKSTGLPLFRLLGGDDPQVSVYAGGGSLCWNPLPLLVREAEALLERGFRALKIKIGHGPGIDAEIISTLRKSCGAGVQLMVDANRAYDPQNALALLRTLEAENVYWFEEPLTYDRPEEWQRLRESSSVQITGGEGFAQISQASDALRDEIVGVLQCDAGGFSLEALLATASLAAEQSVTLTPHSCNSAIGFVVGCHLQRALPNREIQEFETFDSPFIHSIFTEPFSVDAGKIRLSEAAGLGVTLNEETVGRYLVQ